MHNNIKAWVDECGYWGKVKELNTGSYRNKALSWLFSFFQGNVWWLWQVLCDIVSQHPKTEKVKLKKEKRDSYSVSHLSSLLNNTVNTLFNPKTKSQEMWWCIISGNSSGFQIRSVRTDFGLCLWNDTKSVNLIVRTLFLGSHVGSQSQTVVYQENHSSTLKPHIVIYSG